MKKKYILIFMIFFVIFISIKNNVYALKSIQITDNYKLIECESLENIKQKIQDASSEYYAYNEDMCVTVKMKVTKSKDNSGNIVYLLGTGGNTLEWTNLPDNIYDNGDREEGSSWDIWLAIGYTLYDPAQPSMYNAEVQVVYLDDNGDFDPAKDSWWLDRYGAGILKKTVGAVAKTVGTIQKVADGLIEFLKHPIGKPVKEMMDFIGPVVGDNIQWLANLFQTVPEYTSGDGDVLYSYSDLENDTNEEQLTDTSSDKEKDKEKDKGKGNRNKYTNVAKSKEDTKDSQAVFQVDVKKDLNNNDEADFSSSTKIPVMVGDLYNVAAGKIDFFDINFLNGNKEKKSDGTLRHENDSIWNNLRKVVSLLTHISLYMASAIIVLSLIWYGINIVRHTFDNPVAKMEGMEGIKRFFTAVLMLIGAIVIMALCIFGSKVFFDLLNKNDSYELPIRVNVEDQYSFSTTPTGYVRYMSLTEDIEEPLQKFVYTNVYIVLAIANLAVMLIMFARTIVIWVLSIIGPLIAVLYVFNAGGTITFRRWTGLYLRASLIQIFISIAYIVIFKAVIAVM